MNLVNWYEHHIIYVRSKFEPIHPIYSFEFLKKINTNKN